MIIQSLIFTIAIQAAAHVFERHSDPSNSTQKETIRQFINEPGGVTT